MDGEIKEKKLPSNPTLICKMRLLNFWVLQDIKTLLLNFSHQSQKKKILYKEKNSDQNVFLGNN